MPTQPRLVWPWLLAGWLLATLVLAPIGCKQGPGERCQRNSDCDSDLACVAGVCGGIVAPTIDAAPPIDASDAAPIDARPIDAAPADL
jgi:hypothetical protein